MPQFGKRADGAGGRRTAVRNPVLLPAALISIATCSGFVEILDLSSTGAKVRATGLPAVGKDVVIKIEDVEAFGTVKWKRGDQCGVAFDRRLNPLALRNINLENAQARLMKLSPEEKRALDAWQSSLAR